MSLQYLSFSPVGPLPWTVRLPLCIFLLPIGAKPTELPAFFSMWVQPYAMLVNQLLQTISPYQRADFAC